MEEDKAHLYEEEEVLAENSGLLGGHGMGTMTWRDFFGAPEKGIKSREPQGIQEAGERSGDYLFGQKTVGRVRIQESQEMGNVKDTKQAAKCFRF